MNKTEFLELCRTNPEEVFKLVTTLSKTVAELMGQVEILSIQVKALQEENRELKARLNQNSQNSHKPPSTEEFVKTKSQRKKSGKKTGGQKGHPGFTLKMSNNPDKIVVHKNTNCQNCGFNLEGQAAKSSEKRQTFDIPKPEIEVIEHICETTACPCCGTLNKAEFPEKVTQPVQYGENVISMIVYLNQYQLIPYNRIVEYFDELYGIKISEATVYNAIVAVDKELAPAENAIIEALLGSRQINVDETGLRIEAKRQWVHVASNEKLTYYRWHPKRGNKATDEIGILPQYNGRIVHDFWKPYYAYSCDHSLCNAHNIRELTAILELTGQAWPQQMIDLLLEIKERVNGLPGSEALTAEEKTAFKVRYDYILKAGYLANPPPEKPKKRGRPKQGRARNMLNRLKEHSHEVLSFMEVNPALFDNNQAERDLRMIKVKQKISGVFRSAKGATMFCRIRSYLSTARKNYVSAFDAIRSAYQGTPFIPEF